MYDHSYIFEVIRDLGEHEVDRRFGEDIEVHAVEGELFALIYDTKQPLRISLRCNAQLSRELRGRYESVMPGENLNPAQWNTLVLTEQLSEDLVTDLIRHSWHLTKDDL